MATTILRLEPLPAPKNVRGECATIDDRKKTYGCKQWKKDMPMMVTATQPLEQFPENKRPSSPRTATTAKTMLRLETAVLPPKRALST